MAGGFGRPPADTGDAGSPRPGAAPRHADVPGPNGDDDPADRRGCDCTAGGNGDADWERGLVDFRDLVLPAGWATYSRRNRVELPGYAAFMTKEAGLPDLRTRSARAEPPRDLPFASAAVETFEPAQMQVWLTAEEWAVVQVILDPAAFAASVLLPQQPEQPPPTPAKAPFSTSQIDDLLRQHYLKSPPLLQHERLLCVPCGVFAVLKSDGATLRMIWNGIEFNSRCHPPPPFRITPNAEMLQRLLQDGVHTFVAFDFRTWFCQLTCHPAIASLFTTLIDGEEYALAGVPMGWSWACVVAHTLTIGFSRAVLAELGDDARHVLATEYCIDNSIFALNDQLAPARVWGAVQRVAARMNIQLKESATEMGRSVDWLMYRLDAQTKTASFKPEYCERLQRVAKRARRGGGTTVAEVWSAIGLAIYSLYAARRPMAVAAPLWRWLAAHTPPPGVAGSAWGGAAVPHFEHWRLLWDVAELCRQATISPPPYVATLMDTPDWAVTDAAGGGTCCCLRFEVDRRAMVVYQCPASLIAEKELCVLVTAIEAAVVARQKEPRPRRARAVVVWTDNENARIAATRGWALWPNGPLRRRLEEVTAAAEAVDLWVQVMRVDTTRCIADAWTRLDASHSALAQGVTLRSWPRPPCAHRPGLGRVCACDVEWVRADGAPSGPAEAWRLDPPALPALPTGALRTALR